MPSFPTLRLLPWFALPMACAPTATPTPSTPDAPPIQVEAPPPDGPRRVRGPMPGSTYFVTDTSGTMLATVNDLQDHELDVLDVFDQPDYDPNVGVPPDEPLIPERFRLGTKLDVVGPHGPVPSEVVGWQFAGGASEMWLVLRLRPLEGGPTTAGLAVAPGSASQTARYVPLEAEKLLPSDAPSPLVEEVRKKAKALGLQQPLSDAFGRTDAALQGFDEIIFVNVDVSTPDDPSYLSGVAFHGRESGALLWLQPLERRLDAFGLVGQSDVDGDGIDEIVFSSEYYEGYYVLRCAWDGDDWVVSVLEGDGA